MVVQLEVFCSFLAIPFPFIFLCLLYFELCPGLVILFSFILHHSHKYSCVLIKSNLESFKNKTRALGISGCGNYWEISDEVLNGIEAGSYLENKIRHNEFSKDNPFVAKKKFINLH